MKKEHIEPAGGPVLPCWHYQDRVTGDTLSITQSPWYTTLTINRRHYYFRTEDGAFDGTSWDVA